MVNKGKALVQGLCEGAIDTIKMVPGLGILIEGIRAYSEDIGEQQREIFVRAIVEKISALEKAFTDEWYKSAEGQEVTKKIVASALNAEYTDKIEYFANALLNSFKKSFSQSERLKFIEILRQVSKPALEVLALEDKLHNKRGSFYSSQVIKSELIKESNLTPHLVEACINELYSLGVFSSTESYSSDGRELSSFSNGIAAYTEFTKRFIEFIRNPT